MVDNSLSGLERILKVLRKGLIDLQGEISKAQADFHEFLTTGTNVAGQALGGKGINELIAKIGKLNAEYKQVVSTIRALEQAQNKIVSGGKSIIDKNAPPIPASRQLGPGAIRLGPGNFDMESEKMKRAWQEENGTFISTRQEMEQWLKKWQKEAEEEAKKEEERSKRKQKAYKDEAKARTGGYQKPPSSGTGKVRTDIPDEDALNLDSLAKKFPQVNEAIAKFGFNIEEHLVKSSIEASTGIRRWQFQMKDADNVMQNLSVTTDKYGRVLVDTQKRFRSFGASIARNISEVFKWAVAAQLIWLPMRKLQEIFGEMVELQTKLASAAIATGQAYSETSKIFEAANKVAKETGTSILGVVEGYELAYRAAGRYTDVANRSAKATELLRDAMLLASISGISEAKAIDTLAGALIQSTGELENGIDLLDKWVGVSKNAAVSIETLAESFAITSQSAINAGISIDGLNGYIAVLAENTTLSATEVGNAFRSFVTGYQTDTARRELASLGIAIENVRGEALDFDNVIQDIYRRWQSGELSDAELNRLAVAIGGGNRRATQFITLLENLERQQQLVGVSASSAGDAERALATQMQTVTKSLVNLENAFKRFAQTLGTEGGFLSNMDLAVKGVTGLLDILSELTKFMGNSLPLITAFGVAFARNSEGITGALTGVGNNLTRKFAKQPMGTYTSEGYMVGGEPVGNSNLGNFLGTYGLSAALIGTQVLGSKQAGQEGRAGGQLVGGIIGALVGGLAGPQGALIGTSLGSSIAGGIASAIWDYQYDVSKFFEEAISEGAKEGLKELKFEPGKMEQYSSSELRDFQNQLVQQAGEGFLNQIGAGITALLEGTTREEAVIKYQLNPIDKKLLEDMQRTIDIRAGATTKTGEVYTNQYGGIISGEEEKAFKRLNDQVVSGDISSKRFKELAKDIGGFGAIASNVLSLTNDEFLNMIDSIDSIDDAYEYMFDFFYYASEDQMTQIAGMIGSLEQYNSMLAEGLTLTKEQQEEYDRLPQDIFTYITTASKENDASRVKIPNIVDLSKVTQKDLGTVLDYAEERMATIWKNMPEELKDGLEYQDWKNSIEPFLVELEDGTFRVIRDVTSDALQAGAEKAADEGAIAEAFKNIGIADYRQYTAEELTAAGGPNGQAGKLAKELQDAFGYQPQWEDQIVATKDGWAAVTLEQNLTNLILKDILDTQEKQLEGVYNLPANMSLYVPFSGYALGQSGSNNVNISGWDQLMNILEDMRANQPPKVSPEEQAKNIINAADTSDEHFTQRGQAGVREVVTIPSGVPYREDYNPNPPNFRPELYPQGLQFDPNSPYPPGSQAPLLYTKPEETFDLLGQGIGAGGGMLGDLNTLQLPGLEAIQGIINNFKGLGTMFNDLKTLFQDLSAPNIEMEITHTSNLTVDGRQLAQDISVYQGEFLTEQSTATGTSAVSAVI